ELGGSTRTEPLTFDASSGRNPASLGVSGAGGLLDFQIGTPGTPTDCRLPCGSSVHSKQLARAQQQIATANNVARFTISPSRSNQFARAQKLPRSCAHIDISRNRQPCSTARFSSLTLGERVTSRADGERPVV